MLVMRLFVSYSRKDAEFVRRLTSQLEAWQHDVWVDTDDIRGSEAWRASVVEGIGQADAVLLVISPNSMASDNVQREITVAAEERRRIVPVLLQQAQLTGGIRYELAGIQQVSFADRPFDPAAAELQHELTGSDDHAPQSPQLPRSTQLRQRSTLVVVVVLLVAGLFLAFRDQEPDVPSAVGDVATLAPSPIATAAAGGGQSVALDADVWFAGFAISVDGAEYDPGQQAVVVDTTFTNEQSVPAHPYDVLLDEITALEWSGNRAAGSCQCNRLAAGASARTLLTFTVADGFDLADAVLVFGTPRQHQANVPLDGRPAEGPAPVVYDIGGVVDDGAGTSFTVDRVEVLPAACSGLASSLAFGPAPTEQFSIVVWGTATTTEPARGGVGFGEAYLVLPDETTVGSSSLNGYIYVLGPDQPQRDIPVCMGVVGPVTGDYRFVVTAVGVEPDPVGLTFTL